MKKRWYKYPEGYIDNVNPWYVIVRRLIFLPFLFISLLMFYVFIILGWGKSEADRMVKDIF